MSAVGRDGFVGSCAMLAQSGEIIRALRTRLH